MTSPRFSIDQKASVQISHVSEQQSSPHKPPLEHESRKFPTVTRSGTPKEIAGCGHSCQMSCASFVTGFPATTTIAPLAHDGLGRIPIVSHLTTGTRVCLVIISPLGGGSKQHPCRSLNHTHT